MDGLESVPGGVYGFDVVDGCASYVLEADSVLLEFVGVGAGFDRGVEVPSAVYGEVAVFVAGLDDVAVDAYGAFDDGGVYARPGDRGTALVYNYDTYVSARANVPAGSLGDGGK